jgi:hypothetical protein
MATNIGRRKRTVQVAEPVGITVAKPDAEATTEAAWEADTEAMLADMEAWLAAEDTDDATEDAWAPVAEADIMDALTLAEEADADAELMLCCC